MTYWGWRKGVLVAHFTPRQAKWIREKLTDLRRELDAKQRVRPVQHLLGSSTETICPGLTQRRIVDIGYVLAMLSGPCGHAVLRDSRSAWAWIWSLSECRTYLAVRLGLEAEPAEDAPDCSRQSFEKIIAWLNVVIEELIDTADLNYSFV